MSDKQGRAAETEPGGGLTEEGLTEEGLTGGALSAAQEKAIHALLSCVTVEAAAKKAGVSDRTLHRWLRDPGFRPAYLAARRQVMEQAVGTLQRASLGAVEALVRNLKCGVPTVEVSAARVILEAGLKGLEALEFEDRLAAVEESLSGPGGAARA